MNHKKATPFAFYAFLFCSIFLGTTGNGFAQTSDWSAVLPTQFPVNASGQINGISRVSQMKFHPTDSNKMYAISARGGLFISKDKGNSWNVTPGTDFMPSSRLASVCVDYNNDSIIYLGTGDHDYYYNGIGVWKSVNGGQTFTQTSLNNVMIVEMIMDPANDSIIVACTNSGIYKTYNAGLTWTAKTATTLAFDDMKKVEAIHSKTLFAATTDSALYRSYDFGETWTQITNGIRVPTGYTTGDGCRIALTPADTSVVYFAMVTQGGTIFRSANGGNSFVAVKDTVPHYLTYYDDTSTSSTQGDYNFGIGADRTNANILYLVAHNVWRSLDGGRTWTQLTHWWAKVHTDMHQVTVSPYNPKQVWDMNDGGVWLSTDTGNNWTPQSNGIFGYEIYHGNCSPTLSTMISIGTQDNGELYCAPTEWRTNRGGDWSPECAFDYRPNSSMVYYYNGNQRRLVAGGDGSYGLTVTELQDIAFNRSNPNLAFAADTAIYRTFNLLADSPTWVQIANFNKVIMAMHSSLANPNKLFVITKDAFIYVSNNALSATPTFTSYALPHISSNTAGITTIKNKPGVVYTICNNKVYRSADTGATWTNVTYNLPSVNQVRILSDEFYPDSETVFLASTNAVYYKTIGQTTWSLFDAHLPTRPTLTDMSIYNDSTANTMLRVAVYGRGMWQTPIGLTRPLNAIMTVAANTGCAGIPVTFSDVSTGPVVSRLWSFPGGSPLSSTVQNPVVTYAAYGTYPVTLTVYSATDSSKVINSTYVTVTRGANLNVVEGFEDTVFVPVGWSLADPGTDGFAWQRYGSAGAYGTSTACMFFDNYYQDAGGNVNDILTPRYDLTGYSSIKMTFDRAYKVYTDPSEIDSFAILISTDCGATFTQIYRKGGTQLATVSGTGSYTDPAPADWKSDSVDLSPYTGLSAIIAFRNIGHYGNRLFIDNINITGRVIPNAGPNVAICNGDSVRLGVNPVSPVIYQWSPATNLSLGTISQPVASPHTTITYILTATQPYSGISGSDTVLVTVNHLNLIDSASHIICYGTTGLIKAIASAGSGNYHYTWSNGNSTAIDNGISAGVYTVTVHDNATTCMAVLTDSILQRPAIVATTSADTVACTSFGGIAGVTARGGTGALRYNWSNGDTTTAITGLHAGNYVVTITDTVGCTLSQTATVVQNGTPPNLAVTAPDTLTCSVHSVVISASSTTTGATYQWANGANANNDTVTSPGYYSVVATDPSSSCTASDTVYVPQTIVIGNVLITADKLAYCPGDSAQICAPAGYANYRWNTGDTTACTISRQANTFYVTVRQQSGCIDTSNQISTHVFAQPTTTLIDTIDTLSLTNTFSSYQWYRNGSAVSGATNSFYVYNNTGRYWALVTDSNGCSALSNEFIVSSVATVEADRFDVFPNPLITGAWTIEVGSNRIGEWIELDDATGKAVYKTRITNQHLLIEPGVSSGIYLLRILSPDTTLVKKLVKL